MATKINPFEYFGDVVLGNGDFPQCQLPQRIIADAKRLVICDGAANAFVPTGLPFDVIIGDGDSISSELRTQYADRLIIVSDQETNDQTKAVNYLASQGVKQITVVGATGQREDHSMGNISLTMEYLKRGLEVRIFSNHGVFVPVKGNCVLTTSVGRQISIFNFGCKQMSAEGLKYAIRPFMSLWEGTLNEVAAEEVTITADGYYLLYVAY